MNLALILALNDQDIVVPYMAEEQEVAEREVPFGSRSFNA